MSSAAPRGYPIQSTTPAKIGKLLCNVLFEDSEVSFDDGDVFFDDGDVFFDPGDVLFDFLFEGSDVLANRLNSILNSIAHDIAQCLGNEVSPSNTPAGSAVSAFLDKTSIGSAVSPSKSSAAREVTPLSLSHSVSVGAEMVGSDIGTVVDVGDQGNDRVAHLNRAPADAGPLRMGRRGGQRRQQQQEPGHCAPGPTCAGMHRAAGNGERYRCPPDPPGERPDAERLPLDRHGCRKALWRRLLPDAGALLAGPFDLAAADDGKWIEGA